METTDNYINGSDLLLKVAGKAVGHCTRSSRITAPNGISATNSTR